MNFERLNFILKLVYNWHYKKRIVKYLKELYNSLSG